MSDEPLIAVFVDFENLALGVRDTGGGDFRVDLVLKRMLQKGRIVYKRAYGDWTQYRSAAKEFHSHAIELVDIPRRRVSGKNRSRSAFEVFVFSLSGDDTAASYGRPFAPASHILLFLFAIA